MAISTIRIEKNIPITIYIQEYHCISIECIIYIHTAKLFFVDEIQ